MCPGNLRASGQRNPDYRDVFVFDNDYPALLPGTPPVEMQETPLIRAVGESGTCRVLCFSPRHDLTLSTMPVADLERVVEQWSGQFQELGAKPDIQYVLIFENRGQMMGASNPHPHCQIWGSLSLPNEPSKEQRAQQEYLAAHQTCLLCDYLKLERRLGRRLVIENEFFSLVVPFWAVWPYETLVLSRRHRTAFDELPPVERKALADILKKITVGYDRLFDVSCPYSMGFHQRPTDDVSHPEWHFHAHFYPPLLRSASIRKFMVGFEMLGTPQRDITAEAAADRLRQCCASPTQPR